MFARKARRARNSVARYRVSCRHGTDEDELEKCRHLRIDADWPEHDKEKDHKRNGPQSEIPDHAGSVDLEMHGVIGHGSGATSRIPTVLSEAMLETRLSPKRQVEFGGEPHLAIGFVRRAENGPLFRKRGERGEPPSMRWRVYGAVLDTTIPAAYHS